MACFICKGKKLFHFFSLGHQPPSDAFLRAEELSRAEGTYPLDLLLCETCKLVQLGYAVDPEVLFRDYAYNTSTNNTLKKHLQELAASLVTRYKLSPSDLVVDVGSNDGSLLEGYPAGKVRLLGIDPSSVTSIAIEKGQNTLVDFFNEKTAGRAAKKYGKAKIITATNVFAHVKDLHSFMAGIKTLMKEDGVFVSESGYTLDMVEKLQYDFIYHEHLRYYTLKPLAVLFDMFGMEIIDAERTSMHGGAIRVFAGKKGKHRVSRNVAKIFSLEKKSGLYDKKTYQTFAKEVGRIKLELQTLLLDEKRKGSTIVGIGAPAKGNTLLNYCKLDKDIVNCLVEKSELKIGRFTPGLHIPVVSENILFKEQPECALILSWTIADELVKKLRSKGYRGTFIVPSPRPHTL